MDTETKVPNFKLAKVGKEREKKRGGVPLYFGSASVRVPNGLVSALPGLKTIGGKIAMVLIASVFGVAARSIAINSRAAADRAAKLAAANKKPKAFERPKYDDADLAKVQKSKDRPQDSLGMIAGAFGGRSGASGASDPSAADASKAESEKAAPSEAAPEDAKAAPAGGAGAVDPAALAAAAAGAGGAGDSGKSKSPFSSRFGNMSSSLSGGSGLSGGVGRAFEGPKLGERLGGMKGFGQAATPSRTTQPLSSRINPTTLRGKAARQLSKAAQLSQRGASARGEQSAAYGQAAFDNNPGAAQAITGAGARPTGADGSDDSSGGNDSSGGGGGGGGPTEGFGGGSETPSMDDCSVYGPDYINTGPGGCEKQEDLAGSNATPWQMYVDIASYCLIGAGALLTICGILGFIAKTPPASVAIWEMIAMLAKIAALLAGVATLMGIIAITQGAYLQGSLLTLFGGFMTVQAIVTAASAGTAAEGKLFNGNIDPSVGAPVFNLVTGLIGGGYGGLSAANPDFNGDEDGGTFFNPDADGGEGQKDLDRPGDTETGLGED